MLARLDELEQGEGEFVPGHGLFGVGIEPATAYRAIGRITHHRAKRCGRKEACGAAYVRLDKGHLARQIIVHHILTGYRQQRRL
jgi:hypothetical protein